MYADTLAHLDTLTHPADVCEPAYAPIVAAIALAELALEWLDEAEAYAAFRRRYLLGAAQVATYGRAYLGTVSDYELRARTVFDARVRCATGARCRRIIRAPCATQARASARRATLGSGMERGHACTARHCASHADTRCADTRRSHSDPERGATAGSESA